MYFYFYSIITSLFLMCQLEKKKKQAPLDITKKKTERKKTFVF